MNLVYAILIITLMWSCQNSGKADVDQNDLTTSETSTSETPNDSPSVISSINRLDQFDLGSMKKTKTKQSEAGDCSSTISEYETSEFSLTIEFSDCYDHGTGYTYYLLDSIGNIKMVHLKNITPFYEEEDGQATFYYDISQSIIDFRDDEPSMKTKTDTMPQNYPESKIELNENYDSPPWVILNASGDDFVLGNKVDYKGDWYEVSKKAIKDKLSSMTNLPAVIPMESNGQIGMGHRGEYRSMGEEAIKEIVSIKEYDLRQNVDHYKRVTQPYIEVNSPGEKATLAYWQKRYSELF